MPAPFGPDERDPLARRERERDVAQDRAAPDLHGHGVGLEHRAAHSSYPERARRRSSRKNGAPMTAVTTPTGTPPSIRATTSAAASRLAPNSAESGQHEPGVGADEQPHEVRDDEPDEADEPRDRHARRRDERGEREEDRPLAPDVDAEVRGRLLAEQEAVERPRPHEDRERAADDQRRRDGEPEPRGAVEPAQQVAEDLAQAGPGQVHRHREARREQAAHGVPGEQQRRHRRQRACPRQPVDDGHRHQRADERERVEQPELEEHRAHRDQHRDRGPERRPGRGAEHVRVRERVAQQALERAAGDGQPGADDHRRQDARQPQVHDDRLGGRRPGDAQVDAGAAAGRGSRWSWPARGRPSRGRSPRRARRAA